MHYNVKGRGVGERLQEREGEGEKSCTCVRVFALRSAVRARACVVRARVFSACVRGHAQFQRAWLKRVCAPLRCALCSVVCSRAHQQAIQNTTPVQNSSSSCNTQNVYLGFAPHLCSPTGDPHPRQRASTHQRVCSVVTPATADGRTDSRPFQRQRGSMRLRRAVPAQPASARHTERHAVSPPIRDSPRTTARTSAELTG